MRYLNRLVGDWSPGGFPDLVILFTKLSLAVLMMVRGFDYASGDSPNTSRRLGTVESAMPIGVWGYLFLIAACIGFLGMAMRRERMVLFSHASGWVLYWAFAVGVLTDVLERAGSDDLDNYHDVSNIPVASILVALTVAVCCVRAYSEPMPWNKWIALAAVSGAAIGFVSIELDGLRNVMVMIGVGALHLNMAIGTVSRQRRLNIMADRGGEVWNC